MKRFQFRAAGPDGRLSHGVLAADGVAEVDSLLRSRGLVPIVVVPSVSGPGRGGGSRRDLAIGFRSLATLVGAGVPLDRALAATAELPGARLGDALSEARRLLQDGKPLSEALTAVDGGIPAAVLGILRAGERGSRLGPALEQAALQLEQEAELRTRLGQALAYPVVLLVAGSASVIVLATVVLPRFAALLTDLRQALPPATRLLLGLSDLLVRYGAAIGLAIAAAAAAAIGYLRTPAGRLSAHQLLLRLPVIGPLRANLATARVARALGAMLVVGVPPLAALEAAEQAAADAGIATRLAAARRRVAEGQPIVKALAAEGALSGAALQLLGVGESSGRLGELAVRAGDLAAFQSEAGLRTALSLVEPLLVVLFGGLVAFVAAALLQAVYSLRPL